MAGFLRMPWRTFVMALVCGALPMAFTFAMVGHMGSDHPAISMILSAIAPPLLWWSIGKKMMTSPEKRKR